MDERTRHKLLPKFRESAAERAERIAAGLLQWEQGGRDGVREELFRELHTLKGEARLMGFTGLSQVLHAAEDLVRALPEGAGARPAVDALLRACDAVAGLVDGPPTGSDATALLAERLRALAGPAAPAAPREAPAPVAVAPARAGSTVRVGVEELDEIAALAGDLLVDGAKARGRTRELQELLARWSRLGDQALAAADELRQGGEGRRADRMARDVHLLRTDTFRFVRRHADAVSAVQGQFAQLADRVGQARLVPLGSLLAGLPRAARDLAQEQGKEVACAIEGAELGVDRAILLALGDPLIHLLRNAVDHGLEPPAERERAGKPRAGRIAIAARVDGEQLTLTVEDDGRGVDDAAVRAAALRLGVVGESQLQALDGAALHELLFLPGFTTRPEPGEVSGRGVGLDVVRRRVTEVGGSVAAAPAPGGGTRFALRMPQSLALLKVLLVRVEEDVYAIPAADVESVGRIDPVEVTEVAGIRAVRQGERLVPVAALGPLLSLGPAPRARRPAAAFLRHGPDRAAIAVDGLAGEREVAVKSPGAFLAGAPLLTGAAALPDGRAALLLSTPGLVAAARRQTSPPPAPPERRRLRVLLVDDSAIARDAEAALLRSLGHEVEEAVDGEDGWRRLSAGAFHALLTDVQMPVLDGIDLARRVRASGRHARLPVVILSSLAAPEERRRGLDAGADAYLIKGDLSADALAATLERLCGGAQ